MESHMFPLQHSVDPSYGSDSSESALDSDQEAEMLDKIHNTVQHHHRRMSMDQRAAFAVHITEAQAKHDETIHEKKQNSKKRRNSIQYYAEVQAQMKAQFLNLSLERQTSLGDGVIDGLMNKMKEVVRMTEVVTAMEVTPTAMPLTTTTTNTRPSTKLTGSPSTGSPSQRTLPHLHLNAQTQVTPTTAATIAAATIAAATPTTNNKKTPIPTLVLEPMRFGTKPLSSLRPKQTVSQPSPIPAHLTALKKVAAKAKAHDVTTTTYAPTHTTSTTQRRPHSARRVPRQHRSPVFQKPVPSRLRVYLTAIPPTNTVQQQQQQQQHQHPPSRKRQRRRKKWSRSKQHSSLQQYLTLSQSTWNTIIASGKTTPTHGSHQVLTDSELLQVQVHQARRQQQRQQQQQQQQQPTTTKVASPTTNHEAAAEEAWQQLKSRIAQHCHSPHQQQGVRYENFLGTRKRNQLLDMIGVVHERTPDTELIFEAHSAARRALHASAYTVQRWWRHLGGVEVDEGGRYGREAPWVWHKEEQLQRRRQRLRRKREAGGGMVGVRQRQMTWKERYAQRDDRTKPTGKYLKQGGGRFSTANPNSDVDWIVLRSKEIPGPAAYDISMSG